MTDKEFLIEIGKKVRAARKAKGMSQGDLAPLCDIHYSTVSFIETGPSALNIMTLKHIAEALEVSIYDLIAE